MTGVLTTGVHVLVATFAIRAFGAPTPLANGAAFIVATIFSYMVNTFWSFSANFEIANSLRYLLVTLIGFVVAVAVSACADYLGLHYMLGILMVVMVLPPVNFALHMFWTYR
ncbi:MAG: GtrA family protein [Porticoccaceae bacterium]|nr:GtrA family protein [Porticoccaceae bacterium]